MGSFLKKIIQRIFFLLGLTSLVGDIVTWKNFALSILSYYQMVRESAFSILPFDVSDITQDYLVIGSIFAVSLAKASVSMMDTNIEENKRRYAKAFPERTTLMEALKASPDTQDRRQKLSFKRVFQAAKIILLVSAIVLGYFTLVALFWPILAINGALILLFERDTQDNGIDGVPLHRGTTLETSKELILTALVAVGAIFVFSDAAQQLF